MDPVEALAHPAEALRRCLRLAAALSGAAAVRLTLGNAAGPTVITHGNPSLQGDWSSMALLEQGQQVGILALLWQGPDAGLGLGAAALQDVAALIVHTALEARRCLTLEHSTLLGQRAEAMLRVVSEAPSCFQALCGVLQELCQHHAAAAGRIWRIVPGSDTIEEVGRHNGPGFAAEAYYRRAPSLPVTVSTSFTGRAIAANQAGILHYSTVTDMHRYALVAAAVESGLACQVSYPIWLDDERFGISLAFDTDRTDLPAVLLDIGALANTIRPALFRKVAEEHIHFLAHHDELTQLANRLVLQQRMADAARQAQDGEHGLALLFLDLDGFKPINDTHGHAVGDQLLAAVAARLRDGIREGDTVARMGGDEFAVVQTLASQPESALALAHRLLDLIGRPFDMYGRRLSIGVSIGIAVFPDHGSTPDELLRNADTALYRAKDAGRHTIQVFDAAMDAQLKERTALHRDLREAVARHEFSIAYQPLCDTATRLPVAFEALLRWHHPARGLVPPSEFIPLAEENGLILPLGRWVLEQACRAAAAWPPHIRLSVNMSPVQFKDRHVVASINDVLQRTGFPAHRLDLEVTEGLLLDDSGVVLGAMAALKAQGIGLTLDDFGTAYACLSYLRRFPFDRIKIDRSYIQPIVADANSAAIVQAVLSISQVIGLAVVAEGVETEGQLDALRRLGCTCVQGYLLGRPLDALQAAASLQAA